MAKRRNEIMAFTGSLAGIGFAAATLIATVGKKPVSSPWFILCTVVGGIGALAFTSAGLSALPGWVRPTRETLRPSSKSSDDLDDLGAETSGAVRQVNVADGNYGPLTFSAVPATMTLALRLPADVADFTGREAQVSLLDGWLNDESATPIIIVIFGKPGVGKSALSVHVARSMIERYPDAQLYVNLRGADGEPSEPAAVLTGFLRALGMRAADIPEDQENKAGAFRSLIENRYQRTLMVLDNARDVAQIRPLLPGSVRSAVLVTSRVPLAALEGAKLLDLAVMTDEEAVQLLSQVSDRRLSGENAKYAHDAVAACGRLPLAVRIAGALLKQKAHWSLSKLVQELTDERSRLDVLHVGDLDVRASFLLSYRDLPPSEARAFRLLSLLPRTEFPPEPVAAMLDVSRAAAETMLDRLHEAQLVEAVSEARYILHDLIRIFARELRHTESDEVEVAGAQQGLSRYAGSFEAQYRAQLRVSYFLTPSFGPDRIAMDQLYVKQRVFSATGRRELPYAAALRQSETTVVIGGPGSGKTTMATRISMDLAEGLLPDTAEFGFVVRAHDFDPRACESIVEFIITTLRTDFQLQVSFDAVEILLYTGRAAVIVDGLDEVLNRYDRSELVTQINDLRTVYSRAPVMVTSRPVGFDPTKDFPGALIFRLAGLSDDDVVDYMHRMEGAVWQEGDRVPTRASEEVLSVARRLGAGYQNPLILSLLWQVYIQTGGAPLDELAAYEALWALYAGEWDRVRGIVADHEPQSSRVLQYIAYRVAADPAIEYSIDRSTLLAVTTDYYREWMNWRGSDNLPEDFVAWMTSRASLLVESGAGANGPTYRFVLRGLQEYGAAAWLVGGYPSVDSLATIISSEISWPGWREVLKLALLIYARRPPPDGRNLMEALRRQASSNPALLRILGELA